MSCPLGSDIEFVSFVIVGIITEYSNHAHALLTARLSITYFVSIVRDLSKLYTVYIRAERLS